MTILTTAQIKEMDDLFVHHLDLVTNMRRELSPHGEPVYNREELDKMETRIKTARMNLSLLSRTQR